jgi:transmembrane protein TMEM26
MSKTEETLRECSRWICHSFDILKAIIIRIIFALHATIAIIRIVITKGNYWYLLNMCGVNFLLIELIVTIVKRKGLIYLLIIFRNFVFFLGKEPKW